MMTRSTKLDVCAQLPAVRLVPVPEVLDKMVDAVLAYRPKPKSKAAKKRSRKAAKKAKG